MTFVCTYAAVVRVVMKRYVHGNETLGDVVTNPIEADDPMIGLDDVSAMLAVSKRTISRLIKEGDFPEPYRISMAVLRWKKSVVLEWLKTRQAPQGAKE
jgi:predicted DNA-binding transcriptional regulator AlpA